MEWLGVAMVFVGGIFVYCAVRDLSPWQEFQHTLSTARGGTGAGVGGIGVQGPDISNAP